MILANWLHRHTAVRNALQWLDAGHHRAELADVAGAFEALAEDVMTMIGVDSPQLTLALQLLTQAKDAAVRAKILDLSTPTSTSSTAPTSTSSTAPTSTSSTAPATAPTSTSEPAAPATAPASTSTSEPADVDDGISFDDAA